MVANFADPLEACKAVVAESYRLWLQYEVRTDDITMIAIYINANKAATVLSPSGGTIYVIVLLQRLSCLVCLFWDREI